MPDLKQKNDVDSQTSPIRETSPQECRSGTEPLPGNQFRSTPLQCLNNSQENQPETSEISADTTASHSADDNSPTPKTTASQIEGRLVRDETTNELYMPLSSTVVLKRKKEMLYVHLHFENSPRIDALVKSRAYISAIAHSELERVKQQASQYYQNWWSSQL